MQTLNIAAQHGFHAQACDEPIKVHLYTWLVTIGKAVNNACRIGFYFQNRANRTIELRIHLNDIFATLQRCHYHMRRELQ